ncbi:MAG: ABC transporter ATP-binding protein [Phototrophicaceae bacterium]
MTLVQLRNITKQYDHSTRYVLEQVDLDIHEGEFFVILGKSGSGKSTLLNLISGVDYPTQGQVIVQGEDLMMMNERQRTLFRRDHIGIVFQFFNLIPTLTVLENVVLPLELQGKSFAQAKERAHVLLKRVGLADRADTFPDKLSGGEQQRVALARALITEPLIVLADEPTGNLDEETGKLVLDLLLELTRKEGKTLIMATHNPEIVPLADRVCRITAEGKLSISVNDSSEN